MVGVTIELDPGAQQIARLNPWSQELFDNPTIEQIMGDAFEVVPTFADASFDRILHDPPVLSLAGELYSGAFYQQLFRVLKRGPGSFTIPAISTANPAAPSARAFCAACKKQGLPG